MANGTYGTIKPAYLGVIEDNVDVFYYYRPTRGSEDNGFSGWKKGDASWLSPVSVEGEGTLSGMYNLRLPLEDFGRKGIYTIYIKPKEVVATIYDVSTLTGNYSNIRGIVIDVAGTSIENGDLVGYRVEYDDLPGEYRIITSNNKCEPVSQNAGGGTMQKSVRYRFNDSSTLMFCTLTPSTALSFKSSATPVIGKTNETIRLINTKFNPVMLEVEMVSHDADTISTMLEGSQVRNLNNGLITTYDENGNIYHQASYGNIISDDGMNADFKIVHENIVDSETGRLEEIKNQIAINGQV